MYLFVHTEKLICLSNSCEAQAIRSSFSVHLSILHERSRRILKVRVIRTVKIEYFMKKAFYFTKTGNIHPHKGDSLWWPPKVPGDHSEWIFGE